MVANRNLKALDDLCLDHHGDAHKSGARVSCMTSLVSRFRNKSMYCNRALSHTVADSQLRAELVAVGSITLFNLGFASCKSILQLVFVIGLFANLEPLLLLDLFDELSAAVKGAENAGYGYSDLLMKPEISSRISLAG
jgi:hypothetical protein